MAKSKKVNILDASEFKFLSSATFHFRHKSLKLIDTELSKLNTIEAKLNSKSIGKISFFARKSKQSKSKTELLKEKNDILQKIVELAETAEAATKPKDFVFKNDYKNVMKCLAAVKNQAFSAIPEEEHLDRFQL